MQINTIIIGAGAAGLMTAISAISSQKSVLILERNERVGLKILISGGGRCNFTNLNVSAEHYVSENPHFCKSALTQFTNSDFIKMVKDAGIEYYEKTLGQLFCQKSSKEILNLLLSKLDSSVCEIKTETQNIEVEKTDSGFSIHCNHGSFSCQNLVIACGGLSFPKLGATSLGYEIAKNFGHDVTELNPALDGFQLRSQNRFKELSGVSLNATIKTKSKNFTEGLLFTHKGLSGPVALKASLYWNKGENIVLDFAPEIKDFKEWLHEMREKEGKKSIEKLLSQILPSRFALLCLEELKIQNKKVAELSKNEGQNLGAWMKNHELSPIGTIGYEKAEVTRGGVSTRQVDSKTMESKLVPGLFFVGEVLDVTGLLGGYNFQWAWSSGWTAGQNLR